MARVVAASTWVMSQHMQVSTSEGSMKDDTGLQEQQHQFCNIPSSPGKPYLRVEVKGSKDIVVSKEAQAINARHLTISVVIIQHKDVQRCAAG